MCSLIFGSIQSTLTIFLNSPEYLTFDKAEIKNDMLRERTYVKLCVEWTS